ncbi:hypothetical protein B0T18DRAFT_6729 [Schizothecium vesticola]|uniref:Uncharacterized protein n=1 Tax=Schizothecium vesticola TaxID=314040 RepID=A0AA40KBW3_9PEZI|nr:hypothetical protein B0T18DRAFT_6729 [Schizothecium vesticola]
MASSISTQSRMIQAEPDYAAQSLKCLQRHHHRRRLGLHVGPKVDGRQTHHGEHLPALARVHHHVDGHGAREDVGHVLAGFGGVAGWGGVRGLGDGMEIETGGSNERGSEGWVGYRARCRPLCVEGRGIGRIKKRGRKLTPLPARLPVVRNLRRVLHRPPGLDVVELREDVARAVGKVPVHSSSSRQYIHGSTALIACFQIDAVMMIPPASTHEGRQIYQVCKTVLCRSCRCISGCEASAPTRSSSLAAMSFRTLSGGRTLAGGVVAVVVEGILI